jgi:hypothetical protein
MTDNADTEATPADVDTADTVEVTEDRDIESLPSAEVHEEAQSDDEPDTFPRSYVEKLRRESAGYRERANSADTYAQRLHLELVRATGKLADPTDLPFDETHLDDPDALAAAVDALVARKPHLASRRPIGDIGQGPVSGNGSSVDLAAILRQRAQ